MYQEFVKYLKVYDPTETLIHEGEDDTDFFCLLKGKVGIWKDGGEETDGKIKIGHIEEKGTYFGEMSALLQEARTASICALEEPVKVLKFPGEMLPQMMLKQPKLGLKVCTALAGRLRGTTNAQQEVSIQRNEIRDDATSQFLHAKEAFQKVFVMLTTIQKQLQNPSIKSVVEYMTRDKLLQGGRKIRINETFLEDIPVTLIDSIKRAYADKLEE
jgi:CRP-like cAMP-binding protein